MARPKTITPEQISEAVSLYREGKNVSDIMKSVPFCRDTISRYLKESGITVIKGGQHKVGNRKYTFDTTFFDKIDTHNKAYILGFLWADGNNSGDGDLSLCLQQRDVDILKAIKNEMRSDKPLYRRSVKPLIGKNGKTYYPQEVSTFVISSKDLLNKMSLIGFIPRKTHVLRLPKNGYVPDSLLRHFMRGYFDGDGSIIEARPPNKSHKKEKFYNVEYVMKNEGLCDEFIKVLKDHGIYSYKTRTSSIFKAVIGRKEDKIKFHDFLYKGASLYLKRKKDRFDKMIARFQRIKDNKTSRYMGVFWSKRCKKFLVSKNINQRPIYIGRYDNEEDAAKAYDSFCLEKGLSGELNFLQNPVLGQTRKPKVIK